MQEAEAADGDAKTVKKWKSESEINASLRELAERVRETRRELIRTWERAESPGRPAPKRRPLSRNTQRYTE